MWHLNHNKIFWYEDSRVNIFVQDQDSIPDTRQKYFESQWQGLFGIIYI